MLPYKLNRLFLSRGQSLLVQLLRNIWRRKLGNVDALCRWQCPPCLAPNSVLASGPARAPSRLGAIHPRPKMFGSKRVSVFATDRWSYGNFTADRKSTISRKWSINHLIIHDSKVQNKGTKLSRSNNQPSSKLYHNLYINKSMYILINILSSFVYVCMTYMYEIPSYIRK